MVRGCNIWKAILNTGASIKPAFNNTCSGKGPPAFSSGLPICKSHGKHHLEFMDG